MKPSKQQIKDALDDLRVLIHDPATDPITMWVAYAMETAVRWATENTTDWPSLTEEAQVEADLLRKEIGEEQA